MENIKDRATQIIIDDKIVKKYRPIDLEMKVGDLMFNGHLFHRSGQNITTGSNKVFNGRNVEYCWNKNFRAPIPKFSFRLVSKRILFRLF